MSMPDKYNDPKTRKIGSAPACTQSWVTQKALALGLVPLVIWLVVSIINLGAASYEEFTVWLSNPVNTVLAILFIITATYHGILGNQEIIEDYIANERLKKIKLISQKLFFLVIGVLSTLSIVKIAFL